MADLLDLHVLVVQDASARDPLYVKDDLTALRNAGHIPWLQAKVAA